MKTIKYILGLMIVVSFTNCEDIITFEPKGEDNIIGDQAINTKQDLQELLNSIYDVEANFMGGQIQNFSELLADNVDDPSGRNSDYTQIYKRNTDFFNGTIDGVFGDSYIAIYRANVVLMEINDVPGLTDADKLRFESEARFIRALNHWIVVRLFAQPYGYTPSNSHAGITVRTSAVQTPSGRNSVNDVYAQIVSDLQFAEDNLPDENGIYATKWSAKGLLAKVYHEMMDYSNAYDYANEVITSGKFALDDLERFKGGSSTESIFAIVSTEPNDERGMGWKNNYRSDGPNASPTMRSSKELYDLATADTNDLRGQMWYRVLNAGAEDEFYAVSKFDYSFMDCPIVHLTEMKLIRAEAAGELGQNLSVGVQDLNDLRQRAGLTDYSIVSYSDLINKANDERRLEMVFEGDRVHQLKRLGVQGDIDEIRDVPWDCNGMIIQFPNSEGTYSGFEFNPTGGCI